MSLSKAKTQVGLGNTHLSWSCAQQFRGESSPISIKEPENKPWPIHAVEYFLTLGGREALIQATAWVSLGITSVSGLCQAQALSVMWLPIRGMLEAVGLEFGWDGGYCFLTGLPVQLLGSGSAPHLETVSRECLDHCLSSVVATFSVAGQGHSTLCRAWGWTRNWIEPSKFPVLLIKRVCLTELPCLVCVRTEKVNSLGQLLDSVTILRRLVTLANLGLTTSLCTHRVEAQRGKVTYS